MPARILIVDDSHAARIAIRELLGWHGRKFVATHTSQKPVGGFHKIPRGHYRLEPGGLADPRGA